MHQCINTWPVFLCFRPASFVHRPTLLGINREWFFLFSFPFFVLCYLFDLDHTFAASLFYHTYVNHSRLRFWFRQWLSLRAAERRRRFQNYQIPESTPISTQTAALAFSDITKDKATMLIGLKDASLKRKGKIS
jgi:hypothetical protein